MRQKKIYDVVIKLGIGLKKVVRFIFLQLKHLAKFVFFKVMVFEDLKIDFRKFAIGAEFIPYSSIKFDSQKEPSFIEKLKKKYPNLAIFAIPGALIFLGKFIERFDFSGFLDSLVRNWQEKTREFWNTLFEWIELPIAVSNYEYDLLTLVLISISALLYPMIKNIYKKRPARYGFVSIWKYYMAIKGMKKRWIIFHWLKPIITIMVFYYAFVLTNIIDKFYSEMGREFLKTEFPIIVLITLFRMTIMFVLSMMILVLFKRLRKHKFSILIGSMIGGALSSFMTAGNIAFMPDDFWVNNEVQRMPLILLSYLVLFCTITFIHNWKIFGNIAFAAIVIKLVDRLFIYISPYWEPIKNFIQS